MKIIEKSYLIFTILVILLAFFGCKNDDTYLAKSGIAKQKIHYVGSWSEDNYLLNHLPRTHTVLNPSQITKIEYERYTALSAHFGFIGSNYKVTRYYKNGMIKSDSCIVSVAYSDRFTVNKPSQPILKDGIEGREYIFTRTNLLKKVTLPYRRQSIGVYYWDFSIDGVKYNREIMFPEDSKSTQWNPKHSM